MTILAESYFRLAIKLSADDRNALQEQLAREAIRLASEVFSQPIDISVRVAEGTVRGWVRAAGILVIGYGSLRSGLDYLYQDAQKFSQLVLSEVEQSGVENNEILKLERRLATPGKLRRVLEKLDHLKQNRRLISDAESEREFIAINNELAKILDDLDDPAEKRRVAEELQRELESEFGRKFPLVRLELPVAIRPREIDVVHELRPPRKASRLPSRTTETVYHFQPTPKGLKLLRGR